MATLKRRIGSWARLRRREKRRQGDFWEFLRWAGCLGWVDLSSEVMLFSPLTLSGVTSRSFPLTSRSSTTLTVLEAFTKTTEGVVSDRAPVAVERILGVHAAPLVLSAPVVHNHERAHHVGDIPFFRGDSHGESKAKQAEWHGDSFQRQQLLFWR